MNKSYNEIRQTCPLVEYSYKRAAKYGLWVEHYRDGTNEYFVLFSETATSELPLTITHYQPDEL